jgi:hypothetical protein
MPKTNNNHNEDKSLEQWLWDAACSIRGAAKKTLVSMKMCQTNRPRIKTPLPLPAGLRRAIMKREASKLKIKDAYAKIEQLIIEDQNAAAISSDSN